MEFKAKRDLIYGVVLLGTGTSFIIFGTLFPFIYDADIISQIVIFVLMFPLGVYFLWCWFGTNYRIANEYLIIKQGPIKKTININHIESISKNPNPLVASTALSIESYIVQYKPYKTIIIAPDNIDLVVKKLQEISEIKRVNLH